MHESSKIKILIQCIRPPTEHSLANQRIKNIIKKISEKKEIEDYWLTFQPEKDENYSNDYFRIINFLDHKNAIDIIKEINPNVVFIEGELSCSSITVGLAAKFLNIPLVTFHLETKKTEQKISTKNSFKSKMTLMFSNKIFADVSTSSSETKQFKMISFLLKEYTFLLNTLKKMNYSVFEIIKFMTFYPRIQIFVDTIFPINKILEGRINLCANEETAEKLTMTGYKKSTIKVIGDTYYEIFRNLTKEKKIDDEKTQRILFCTSPMHEHGLWTKEEEFKLIKDVIKEIDLKTNYNIALKIHPSTSSLDEYRQTLGDKITIYQKEDLSDILKNYDLMLIYGGSTAIHYAVFMRKPIVLLDFYKKYSNLNWYFDESIGTFCKESSKLLEKIQEAKNKVINEGKYIEYEKKYLGNFQKSSDKACKLILELLKN